MKDNRAFVLITAIIILVVLAALGMFGVSLLSTDIHISLDTLKSTQAFFLADAATEFALESLSNDTDWSDSLDLTGITMAGGTFDIEYLVKTIHTATIKFTGHREEVSRKITANFDKLPAAFDYVVYAGRSIQTRKATNLTIIGAQLEDADDFPTVSFPCYKGSASPGQDITGDYTFTAGTYSGIWYINGNVTIESNVTINGSVITTGNISCLEESSVTINPTSPNPALIAQGNIDFSGKKPAPTTNININGLIYAGTDGAGSVDLNYTDTVNITGTIIAGTNVDFQNSDNVTVTYDETIKTNWPTCFEITISCDTWQETN